MKEFVGYDEMLIDCESRFQYRSLPLIAWEFYAEYNNTLSVFKNDLDIIQKLTKNWSIPYDIKEELVVKKSVVVITNANLKIVYASSNMTEMNGYQPEEVIGNSPKMFQGRDTDVNTSKYIRKAVDSKLPFKASILNYKKDLTTYTCHIKGFPILDKKGKLINYIAFENAA